MAWIAPAITLGTTLLNRNAGSGDRSAADDARAQALAQYTGLSVPQIKDQMINLSNYESAGQVNPLLEQILQQGDSRLSDVNVDPRLRSDQMSALEQMSGLASGQIKPGDVAAFEMARRNAAAEAQAKQGQILQDMQQRGQAGSGAELLARLKASQSGADMLSESNMQQAQMMQQARMQALQNQANMATGLRSQDYSQQADLARARDAINQFNTQNASNTQSRNINTQNNAQLTNLQNRQNIANMNTQTMNQQQIYNKGLTQQQYRNQLGLANAKANALTGAANSYDKRAADSAGFAGQLAQGVGTVAASVFGK